MSTVRTNLGDTLYLRVVTQADYIRFTQVVRDIDEIPSPYR